jgi:hypothetical protein
MTWGDVMQTNAPEHAPEQHSVGGGGVRNSPRYVVNLLNGVEDAPNNYRVTYGLGGESGTPSLAPRHRHAFDQVRFVLNGDYSIRPNEVQTGRYVSYFPEGAFYGPVEIGPTVEEYTIQFGGATGLGYPSPAQRKRGAELLAAQPGKVENGIYTWVDEHGTRHNQDGFEALYEQIVGGPVQYPSPRYEAPIVMNPEHTAWVDDPVHPGVAHKTLGIFTEREVRVGFVKIDRGASMLFGTAPAPETLFLVEGAIEHDGTTDGRLSAFATAADEDAVKLTATEPAELFYVKMPTY